MRLSSFPCEVISAYIKLLLQILETMCTTEKMQLSTSLAVEPISVLQTALSFSLTDMISVQNNAFARIKQCKDE